MSTAKKLKCEAELTLSETEISNDDKRSTDEELVFSDVSSEEDISVRNTKEYPELCKAVDRCKISNRDACVIVNAVLKDISVLTTDTAIDAAKLRRQGDFWRGKEVEKHADDVKAVICIGFYGKQDITLVRYKFMCIFPIWLYGKRSLQSCGYKTCYNFTLKVHFIIYRTVHNFLYVSSAQLKKKIMTDPIIYVCL